MLADSISGLHQEGLVERYNRAVCVAHVSQLAGYSRFSVMVQFTRQTTIDFDKVRSWRDTVKLSHVCWFV